MIGCKGQSNARHSVIQSRRVAKVAASANSPFDLPSDKVQSEAYPKREPDVLLCVADGKEVPAYSEVLYLASDALRELLSQAWEELHAGMDYGPFCPASVLHLPLPDDSAAGWVHVLDLISPDRPDLPLDKLNLVGGAVVRLLDQTLAAVCQLWQSFSCAHVSDVWVRGSAMCGSHLKACCGESVDEAC